MLNSFEHEILNAHKYKNIKKYVFFLGSHKPKMLCFPLINVKMPTIVSILTFMSRKDFILSWVEHEKSFITSGLVCFKFTASYTYLLAIALCVHFSFIDKPFPRGAGGSRRLPWLRGAGTCGRRCSDGTGGPAGGSFHHNSGGSDEKVSLQS